MLFCFTKVAICFSTGLALVLLAGGRAEGDEAVPAEPPLRWYKGNLHTHTLWSDGNDFPEMVAEWYRSHGYNFLALSDHNVLSEGIRWMRLKDIQKRGGGQRALARYRSRFGGDWVETRRPGGKEDLEVRLKPLGEFRALVEERGKFIMIQSEEITHKHAHINTTNIARAIQPLDGRTIRETIEANLRAVNEQARQHGRMIMPHLNHPNLGNKGISAEDLAQILAEQFFEVFNGIDGDGDRGSDTRHSLEKLWDITSTLRIGLLQAPPMYGLATDDTHDYFTPGSSSSAGRGWVMVRARYLTPESLIRALRAGNYYSSSGVVLQELQYNEENGTLELKIEPDSDATFRTDFIGTPVGTDLQSVPRLHPKSGKPIEGTREYSAEVGKVLASVPGLNPRYDLTGHELYVRAVVTSSKAPDNPTSESPHKQAWTQPVGWHKYLTGEDKGK